jgi:hypothetical protein
LMMRRAPGELSSRTSWNTYRSPRPRLWRMKEGQVGRWYEKDCEHYIGHPIPGYEDQVHGCDLCCKKPGFFADGVVATIIPLVEGKPEHVDYDHYTDNCYECQRYAAERIAKVLGLI